MLWKLRRVGTAVGKALAIIRNVGLVAVILGGNAEAASPKPPRTDPAQAPQTAFPGEIAEKPARWTGKPREALDVWFCTHGPLLPKGSLVTLVPGNSDLNLLTVRVVGPRKPFKGGCKGIEIESIKQPDWVRWDWSKGGWWSFRIVVLLGDQPKAKAIKADGVDVTTLPQGTRQEDVRRAVDIDGDGRVDVVVRFACKDGSHSCEEFGCQETWILQDKAWQRYDTLCGD
jgi:hypothetical protein